jgi:hypothetical protein
VQRTFLICCPSVKLMLFHCCCHHQATALCQDAQDISSAMATRAEQLEAHCTQLQSQNDELKQNLQAAIRHSRRRIGVSSPERRASSPMQSTTYSTNTSNTRGRSGGPPLQHGAWPPPPQRKQRSLSPVSRAMIKYMEVQYFLYNSSALKLYIHCMIQGTAAAACQYTIV